MRSRGVVCRVEPEPGGFFRPGLQPVTLRARLDWAIAAGVRFGCVPADAGCGIGAAFRVDH